MVSYYVQSVWIQSFCRPAFSHFWTECGDLFCKFLYSAQLRENTDQKKICIWLFTRRTKTQVKWSSFGHANPSDFRVNFSGFNSNVIFKHYNEIVKKKFTAKF